MESSGFVFALQRRPLGGPLLRGEPGGPIRSYRRPGTPPADRGSVVDVLEVVVHDDLARGGELGAVWRVNDEVVLFELVEDHRDL